MYQSTHSNPTIYIFVQWIPSWRARVSCYVSNVWVESSRVELKSNGNDVRKVKWEPNDKKEPRANKRTKPFAFGGTFLKLETTILFNLNVWNSTIAMQPLKYSIAKIEMKAWDKNTNDDQFELESERHEKDYYSKCIHLKRNLFPFLFGRGVCVCVYGTMR